MGVIDRAERNIIWCERFLCIPEGRFVGRPLRLTDYMKDDLRAIYDNPNGTRRAIISRARKNAKTIEGAIIVLLHLCGPEAVNRLNSQIYSAAQSRDQASLIFGLAAKMVRMSPDLLDSVVIKESAKTLICPELGTMYRALSAEATTAYGLSPALIIHDELGQVRGPRSQLYDALETAVAAQEEPLSIIISTQASSDADLLSILIDDAKAGHDPRVVLRMNTAPMDAAPFAEETIALANPALYSFMNRKEVLSMAEDARRMPARESEFRNLVLNQRVEALSTFINQTLWKSCGGPVLPLQGEAVYAGLDLSSVADLTALVLTARIGDEVHVLPFFWLPGVGIADKSQQDRVPYDMWAEQGFLHLTIGKTVEYKEVAIKLRHLFDEYNIHKLAFDRWNLIHLKPWLLEAGFTEVELEEKFVPFGQGTQSMSPALRDLEQLIISRQLVHGSHPVLTMCAANAVVEGKDDSNRKLSKNRSTGRIDGMVALAMAVGVMPLPLAPKIDVMALIG